MQSLAAKFCNECGSPLHLKPCPKCDAVNGATSKACYMCGAFFPMRGSELAETEATQPILADDTAEGADLSSDRRPERSGVTATALPFILLGVVGVAVYFLGYVQTGRDWVSGAWATLTSNREVVATTAEPSKSSVPPSTTPTADVNTAAAETRDASSPASAPPNDATSAPPNQAAAPAPSDSGGINSTPGLKSLRR